MREVVGAAGKMRALEPRFAGIGRGSPKVRTNFGENVIAFSTIPADEVN